MMEFRAEGQGWNTGPREYWGQRHWACLECSVGADGERQSVLYFWSD